MEDLLKLILWSSCMSALTLGSLTNNVSTPSMSWTEKVKNFLQCEMLCRRRDQCRSVYYSPRTRECTSRSADTDVSERLTVFFADGSVKVLAGKWSAEKQNRSVCEANTCGESQVCTELGSKTLCLIEGTLCGRAPGVANATSTMSKLDNTIQVSYSCRVGYGSESGTTTSTCEANGKWTPPSLQCAVDCGVPDVSNSSLVSTSVVVGAVGRVKCDTFFRFFGSNDTVVCQSSGKWAGPNGTCLQVEWKNQGLNVKTSIPGNVTTGWQMVLYGSPGTGYIPGTFKTEWQPDPEVTDRKFAVTLGNASDVHMFMEVLFSSKRDFKTVVFNRYIGGKWHLPSRYADRQSFPFEKTKPFILQLVVEKTVFKVIIKGKTVYKYPHFNLYSYIDRVAISHYAVVNQLKFFY